MAPECHNIDTSTGRAAIAMAGRGAWHNLGVVVEDAFTSEEGIRLAGLDWTVEQHPLFTDFTNVTSHVANVRSDTGAILGVVGVNYQPLQNKDAFAFLDEAVAAGETRYETAGALNGGKTVWMLARMPRILKAGPTDEVIPYALLTNSHDGTRAVTVMPSTIRVVCRNTFNLATRRGREKNHFRARHTAGLNGRVREASEVLGLVNSRLDSFQEEIDALARVSLSGTEVRDYFEGIFPTPKPKRVETLDTRAILDRMLEAGDDRRAVMDDLLAGHREQESRAEKRNAAILEQVLANFENETNTLPGIQGTAWAAYNAVSEYADHQAKTRGGDEGRLKSAWFGSAHELKETAYAAALELAAR